jgi:hypothetical protein
MFTSNSISPYAYGIFFGFALVLSYFYGVDVYHQSFFTSGTIVVFYNLMRVCFILCLLWLLYFSGRVVLTFFAREAYAQTSAFESVLFAFFAGVGVWQITLEILGFAGLYQRYLLMGMTLLIFFASIPTFSRCLRALRKDTFKINWIGCMLMAAPISLFIMVKGLYPAGGHDYFTHYFHFYRTVTETGRIWPNEVWYHFYYSKGAGLFFLSMLLTDPLAPQLATTVMIMAGAGVVFSFLRSATGNSLLPWIGAALYVAFLIYTPGPHVNLVQGGWGDLEKIHESSGVLMLTLIWLVFLLRQSETRRVIGVTLILTMSALVLINPVLTVFAGSYLTLMCLYFLASKQKEPAKWTAITLIVAGVLFSLLLLVNYLFSGLPDDQLLFMFWPYIHYDTIKQWGVLFEIIYLHWAKTGLVANEVTVRHVLPLLLKYLRLDVWGVLLFVALVVIGIRSVWRQRNGMPLTSAHKKALSTVLIFLFLMATIFVIIGRAQPISFYRFTTFSYAPMLCLCLLLLATVKRKQFIVSMMVLALTFGAWKMSTGKDSHRKFYHLLQQGSGNIESDKLTSIIKNSLRFARGQYSLFDAYSHQEGWPGRMPWGGIYPPAMEAWKRVPPKTRIWSFHIHSYCMLPDCHMEGFMSYRFSHHPYEVYYGDPKTAKKYLQQEGLNYFFISHTLILKDMLPLTPLFSPKNIAHYLGIVWTDGDNSLLTWKEQTHQAIDAKWLARYQEQMRKAKVVKAYPYAPARLILQRYAAQGKLTKADMPW